MTTKLSPLQRSPKRVQGLDTLRFFAALWVMISHVGPVPYVLIPYTISGSHLINGVFHNLFNGLAAVIVFFVISGFCIHYPYREGQPLPFLSYFVRRSVRIGIPLLGAILLAHACRYPLQDYYRAILWSLVAEMIYYLIYPVIHWLRFRWGWGPIFGVAIGLYLIVIIVHFDAKDYHNFGFKLTWIVGLPVWLLGCLLAERTTDTRGITTSGIWFMRVLVYSMSCLGSLLRFHTVWGYPETMNLFGVLVYFWIFAEIRYRQKRAAFAGLEWCGKWSYSIYLIHPLAEIIYRSIFPMWLNPALLFASMFFYLIVSYGFYLCIEKPAHQLAYALGNIFTPGSGKPGTGWNQRLTRSLVTAIGIIILSLGVLIIQIIHSHGGWRYLQLKKKRMRMSYQSFMNAPGRILLLGDSLIEYGDWEQSMEGWPIENRGQGGATSSVILNRLDHIILAKPKALFVMMGINDLWRGVGESELIGNFQFLISECRSRMPQCQLIISSILPVNEGVLQDAHVAINLQIKRVNHSVESLCDENHIRFLDLNASFADQNGQLLPSYTTDGVHLNSNGYEIFTKKLIQTFQEESLDKNGI